MMVFTKADKLVIKFLKETKHCGAKHFLSEFLQSRGKICQRRIEDVSELNERIKAAWEELDQHIIDTAVRQWRTRLHACVKAKGDHFEHKLP